MTADMRAYDLTLEKLAGDLPRLVIGLQKAQVRRAKSAATLAEDIRFKGINELLSRLDRLAEAFAAEPTLAGLAAVVRRSVADFETAVEATLSGYGAVAFDAMRDILEIEYQLRDFAVDPARIDEWLIADDETLRTQFAPAQVRKRLKTAGAASFGENALSVDYKAHSMMLHLSPRRTILPDKGVSPDGMYGNDVGFWEIFEHARGLWGAISALTEKLASGSSADLVVHEEPAYLVAAWRLTNRAQMIFFAVLKATDEWDQGDHTAATATLGIALRNAGAIDPSLVRAGSDVDAFYAEVAQIAKSGHSMVKVAAATLLAMLDFPTASNADLATDSRSKRVGEKEPHPPTSVSVEPRMEEYQDFRSYIEAFNRYHDRRKPSERELVDRAVRLVGDARRAASLQIRRIREPRIDPDEDLWRIFKVDVPFLVTALSWLVRSAEIACAIPACKNHMDGAISDFNRAVPDLRKMRNVREHIDDYAHDIQTKRTQKRSDGRPIGRRQLEVGALIDDGFRWLDCEIRFEPALDAVAALHTAVRACRDLLA